ncbi:MAG: hypothetical protein QXS93_04615 [Candidatus Micrarchaeia archaeon]
MIDKLVCCGILLVILFSCPITQPGTDEKQSDGMSVKQDSGSVDDKSSLTGSLVNAPQYMLSLCPNIKTTRWRQMCEAVFGMDMKKCELQRQHGEKEVCESMIAAVKKQPSLCDSVNPYVTGVKDGKVVNLTISTDCYKHYAVATLDSKYCEKSKSPANCEADIKMEKGQITLEQCKDGYTCLMDYAKIKRDKRACDQFKPASGGGEADSKATCLAMVTGDESYCDSISSIDWKYRCIGWARWNKAMESDGVFLLKECKGNSDCEMLVLYDMEKWAARN